MSKIIKQMYKQSPQFYTQQDISNMFKIINVRVPYSKLPQMSTLIGPTAVAANFILLITTAPTYHLSPFANLPFIRHY